MVRKKLKKNKKRSRERKQLVAIVPAKWTLLKRVERLRDTANKANWDFKKLLSYTNLEIKEEQDNELSLTTRTYYPSVAYIHEESLKQISQALEKLSVIQTSNSWARHLETLDIFKPNTTDKELKQWSDWKFSYENYVKGIDAGMAHSMKLVEENLMAAMSLTR